MYYNMVFAKNVLKPSAAGENNRFFKEKRFWFVRNRSCVVDIFCKNEGGISAADDRGLFLKKYVFIDIFLFY